MQLERCALDLIPVDVIFFPSGESYCGTQQVGHRTRKQGLQQADMDVHGGSPTLVGSPLCERVQFFCFLSLRKKQVEVAGWDL